MDFYKFHCFDNITIYVEPIKDIVSKLLVIITLLSNIVGFTTIAIRPMKAAWLKCWTEHRVIPVEFNHLSLPQEETESFVVHHSTSRTEV